MSIVHHSSGFVQFPIFCANVHVKMAKCFGHSDGTERFKVTLARVLYIRKIWAAGRHYFKAGVPPLDNVLARTLVLPLIWRKKLLLNDKMWYQKILPKQTKQARIFSGHILLKKTWKVTLNLSEWRPAAQIFLI
jgi:hypothetical protein